MGGPIYKVMSRDSKCDSKTKKENRQIFLAKLSEKLSVTSQYPSKCARPFIYGCALIRSQNFLISKKNI